MVETANLEVILEIFLSVCLSVCQTFSENADARDLGLMTLFSYQMVFRGGSSMMQLTTYSSLH